MVVKDAGEEDEEDEARIGGRCETEDGNEPLGRRSAGRCIRKWGGGRNFGTRPYICTVQ